jgi:hypothetical protein
MSCFPGWTWEYVDEHMTLPRLAAIVKYHNTNPPLHWMAARYLGYGASAEKTTAKSELDEDGLSLFDHFPVMRG